MRERGFSSKMLPPRDVMPAGCIVCIISRRLLSPFKAIDQHFMRHEVRGKYLPRSWLQKSEFYRVFRVTNSKHLPQYYIGIEDSQTLT